MHGILDKEDTDVTGKDGYVMTLGFYDDLGYSYTAKFAVSTPKTTQGLGTGNNYFISLTDIIDSKGNSIVTKDENGNAIKTKLVSVRCLIRSGEMTGNRMIRMDRRAII